jgi:hypothetical protein
MKERRTWATTAIELFNISIFFACVTWLVWEAVK